MNKIQSIISAIYLMIVPCLTYGQLVSERTNQIKLDFKKGQKATTLPQITWEYPNLRYTNSPEIKVKIKANISSKLALEEVHLVARTPRKGDTLGVKRIPIRSSRFNITLEQQIYLPNGENYLEIFAQNVEGGLVKDSRTVIVGQEAITQAVAIDRKDYALLFATDKYNHWTDLANPVYDAKTIANELEKRYNFKVEVVKNYNKEDVFTKLREYSQKNYKPQDQLFIFFAGHGQYDEVFREGYLVGKNALLIDETKSSYISYNRLRNIINNIPVKHVFLTMDVCYGGTFNETLGLRRGGNGDLDKGEFIVKKLSTTTRKYLTSGNKEYVSDGVPGHHSPFARKFISALKTNGGEDRILTLAEMKVHMQKLQTTPRFGGFGIDEPGSEFLFIAR